MRVWQLAGQNLLARPQGGIILTPGQVVQARVLAIEGDAALLALLGRRLEVESRVPLQEGQVLRLAVRGFAGDGRVELQIIPPAEQAAGGEDGNLPLERLLAAALERLGAGQARGFGLLERLAEAARELQLPPARLPALAWLVSRGLPPAPSLLRAVAEWQQASPLAAPTWQDLLAALPPEQRAELARLVEGISMQPDQQPQALAETLRQLPARLGLDWEARLKSLLDNSRPAGRGQADGRFQPVQAREGRREEGAQTPGGLKAFLLALAREATGAEGALARRLADQLTHLQLLNLPGPDGGISQALAGLAWLHGRPLPFYLRAREEERGGPPPADRALVVLIFLATPRLGMLSGRLALQGDLLTCNLAVENEAARRLVESRLGELRRALGGLPYRVEVAPCALRPRGEGAAAWAREFGTPWPPAGALDILV